MEEQATVQAHNQTTDTLPLTQTKTHWKQYMYTQQANAV